MAEQEARMMIYDILSDVFMDTYDQTSPSDTAEEVLKRLKDLTLKMYFEARDGYDE